MSWTIGLVRTVTSLDATTSIILEVLFIVTGSLLGLYLFLIYCLSALNVRMVWKRLYYRVTCQDYQSHKVPEKPEIACESIRRSTPGGMSSPSEKQLHTSYSATVMELKKMNYSTLVTEKSVSPDQEIHPNMYRESSEEGSCTDMPVAKSPSPIQETIAEEKLDSSAIDKPDPSEETEL